MAKGEMKRTQTGVAAVRAHFIDALDNLNETKAIEDIDPSLQRDGIKPGQWEGAPWSGMPPKCPVRILGMKGETVWAVSATDNLMGVDKWDLPTLAKLFAPYPNYMLWAWPAFAKAKADPETGELLPPKVARLERDKCAMALITEAGRRGIFDPSDQVRGRGGWRTEDGDFIWHSGDALWTVQAGKESKLQQARPSEYHGYFYAKNAAILHPWKTPIDWRESPAHQLLQDLKTWNWERPYLDPILYLGWIASGYMGGALDVRPIMFTTGGQGVGKSTLHNVTRALFGTALYSTANTTAAGIYQNIKQDSRPIAVDEFEADRHGDNKQKVIELARQAYSGAKLYRGGQNHDGVEFELRSSFLFSAILHPPLGVQDKSRMAILNLRKLDKGHGRQPVISDIAGRMILRQIMDGWHEFNDNLLPKWRGRLNSVGFDARAIDTYGTLLAAAELLVTEVGLIDAGFPALNGHIDEEALIDTIRLATAADMAEQIEKWEETVQIVLSASIDNWKAGERPTVGKVLELLEANIINLEEARDRFATIGLGLLKSGQHTDGLALAVPAAHPALDKIFDNTEFRSGGWMVALRQAPEKICPSDKRGVVVSISKVKKRCILVDLDAYDKHTSA